MYYKKRYTLDILYIFSYYVDFMKFCIFKFPISA